MPWAGANVRSGPVPVQNFLPGFSQEAPGGGGAA